MSGVCLGPQRQENGGLILNGYRVSDLQDEKSYGINGSDGCITMWILFGWQGNESLES